MKTYTFELVIREGSDEWWEGLNKETHEDGLFEVERCIAETLRANGFCLDSIDSLTLKKFEDDEPTTGTYTREFHG